MGEHLKLLWNDRGIIQTYEQRSQYQLTDSAKYFFDRLDEVRNHHRHTQALIMTHIEDAPEHPHPISSHLTASPWQTTTPTPTPTPTLTRHVTVHMRAVCLDHARWLHPL